MGLKWLGRNLQLLGFKLTSNNWGERQSHPTSWGCSLKDHVDGGDGLLAESFSGETGGCRPTLKSRP